MKLKYFIFFIVFFIHFNFFGAAQVVVDSDPDSVLSGIVSRSCLDFLQSVVGGADISKRDEQLDKYRAIWTEDLASLESLHREIDERQEQKMRDMIDALNHSATQIEGVFLAEGYEYKFSNRVLGILRNNLESLFCKRKRLIIEKELLPGMVDDGSGTKVISVTEFQILFPGNKFKKTASAISSTVSAFDWFKLYDIGGQY